jgi:hypothetical protein
MSEEDEKSFKKGSVTTHPVAGLSYRLYLAHELEAIGTI